MTATATSVVSVKELLRTACSRNTPAELHFEDAKNSVIVGRVRMLELTKDRILADRPQYVDGEKGIPRGAKTSVYLSVRGTRYRFDSAIEQEDLLVRLNADTEVRGVALRLPDRVAESQRRENHRQSIVSFNTGHVYAACPHPEIPDTCALDSKRFVAQLADISVGGVSLLVARRELSTVCQGAHYFLSFTLPCDTGDFQMLARVQHHRKIESTGALRVGLEFRSWRGRKGESEQLRLSQALATLERRSLQRRR